MSKPLVSIVSAVRFYDASTPKNVVETLLELIETSRHKFQDELDVKEQYVVGTLQYTFIGSASIKYLDHVKVDSWVTRNGTRSTQFFHKLTLTGKHIKGQAQIQQVDEIIGVSRSTIVWMAPSVPEKIRAQPLIPEPPVHPFEALRSVPSGPATKTHALKIGNFEMLGRDHLYHLKYLELFHQAMALSHVEAVDRGRIEYLREIKGDTRDVEAGVTVADGSASIELICGGKVVSRGLFALKSGSKL